MMDKILLIHRAEGQDDVSINLTLTNNRNTETCINEGEAIAEVLWNTLPATTYKALLVRLKELDEELTAREMHIDGLLEGDDV